MDDPVGAIAVHGFGGVFGTISVAIFGESELLVHDRGWQFMVQFIGVSTCFLFTTSFALIMFYIIKQTIGLRVSPEEEYRGAFVENLTNEQKTQSPGSQKVTQIAIQMSKRGYNMYSINEYLRINQNVRKKLIESKRVKYMDESGASMQPLDAVRQLGLHIESQKEFIEQERNKIQKIHIETEKNVGDAAKMQNAIFGSPENLTELFEDSFILFKPRIKVSGDFYWFRQIGSNKVIIVGNANTSGVSGAFLSILGVSIINEIMTGKINEPDKILDIMDAKLTKALGVKTLGVKLEDSIDLSVVVVDEIRQTIKFSGANNGMLICSGSTSTFFHGDECSIGLKEFSNVTTFQVQKIKYKPGDMVYLFTDGYYVQSNQNGDTKLLDAFTIDLKEISSKEINKQKETLELNFADWSAGQKQEDDVLVIGLKLR